jgi:hypothetical protein
MDVDALIRRAATLLEKGDAKGAAAIARSALAEEDDPGRSIRLRMLLADALVAMGDTDEAVEVLRMVSVILDDRAGIADTAIAPQTARAHVLGRRRLEGPGPPRDMIEAQRWAERLSAVGWARSDRRLLAEGQLLLGLVASMGGRPWRARHHATLAAEMAPSSRRRLPVDFAALLALVWWLGDRPGRAIQTIDLLGRDRPGERSVRAAARFDLGEVDRAAREADLAWEGLGPPGGLEAIGGLLAWPSTDPLLGVQAAETVAAAHRAGQPLLLPHLVVSLAARALFRSRRRQAGVELARDVRAALVGPWPRGAAVYALEVLEDEEPLARSEARSSAALRARRLAAVRRHDQHALRKLHREFEGAGLLFESAQTLVAAGRAAAVRGMDGRGMMSDGAARLLSLGARADARRVRAELARTAGPER